MMKSKDKKDTKKLKEIDNEIKNKAGKFILHLKQIFSFFLNPKNIRHIRNSKDGDVVLKVIYYGKDNEIIHSAFEECDNIIHALHVLYTRTEPLFVNHENDSSLFFYELFDNIVNAENLFKIKNIEFSLELKRNYKFEL